MRYRQPVLDHVADDIPDLHAVSDLECPAVGNGISREDVGHEREEPSDNITPSNKETPLNAAEFDPGEIGVGDDQCEGDREVSTIRNVGKAQSRSNPARVILFALDGVKEQLGQFERIAHDDGQDDKECQAGQPRHRKAAPSIAGVPRGC